jgi:hypothetical protein
MDDGTRFARREGWFLETMPAPTVSRLRCHEAWLKAHDKLPAAGCISVDEAEKTLWRALSDEQLVAEDWTRKAKRWIGAPTT